MQHKDAIARPFNTEAQRHAHSTQRHRGTPIQHRGTEARPFNSRVERGFLALSLIKPYIQISSFTAFPKNSQP
jgi:hypothetical protein